MTEDAKNSFDESPEYRAELLQRAALLGITVHPNAKNETVAAKIAAKMAEQPEDEAAGEVPAQKADEKANKDIHPMKRLHRVIVTCNDPQKADQTGDMISVSNSVVGNMRFYFHFNKPWHIPEIVLNTIAESKLFLHSSRRDGREQITREVPRYNIQYLPALSDKERERIQAKQAAALATEE